MCMYIYTYKNRMIRSLVNFESKNDHASNDDIEMTKSLLQQTWIHIRSKRLSPDRSSSISCIRISQIHRRERNKKPVSLYYWGNKGECYARWTILLIIDYKRQSCEETRENNTARFRSASSRTIFETRRRIFYEFSICWTIYCLILLTGRLPFIILDPEIRSVVVRAYERNFNERRRGGREKKGKSL